MITTQQPPVAIFLCDESGIMAKPWADAGVECWCIDIKHSIRRPRIEGNVHFVWGDIRTWNPPAELRGRIVFIFAFPPCTHVAVSGARDFRTKGSGLLRDSLELFSACEHAIKWAGVPGGIENPVGKFSSHMGEPDHTFQPWEYGDLWTKRTCIWAYNGFVMPTKIHELPPPMVSQRKYGSCLPERNARPSGAKRRQGLQGAFLKLTSNRSKNF